MIALLAFFSGYFDPELSDERRWLGWSLIVAAIVIAWPAVARMVADWPRMKPQHNVDLAFIQIGVGVVILTVAFFLGGRAGAFLAPLVEPPPKAMPPSPPGPTA